MRMGWLFFGDKDNVLVDEFMKAHNIDKSKRDVVKSHFETMVKNVEKDLTNDVEA